MSDTPVTSVTENGRPKGREDITVGHQEVPVKVYRTDGFPCLFAGFQQHWVDGNDPETGTTFELSAGAGCGSAYATLTVEVPGHPKIHEYVDIRELLGDRVRAIVAELTSPA